MTWETEVIVGKDQDFPEAMVAVRMATKERVRYVPERTCHAELKGFDPSKTVSTCHYACSACGYVINRDDGYCKSCGAKVVEHD